MSCAFLFISSGEAEPPFKPAAEAFLGEPARAPRVGEDRSEAGAVPLVAVAADPGTAAAAAPAAAEAAALVAPAPAVVAEAGAVAEPGPEFGDVPVVADLGGGSCLLRGEDSPPRLAPLTTLERSAESLLAPLTAETGALAPVEGAPALTLPAAAFACVVAVEAVLVALLAAN